MLKRKSLFFRLLEWKITVVFQNLIIPDCHCTFNNYFYYQRAHQSCINKFENQYFTEYERGLWCTRTWTERFQHSNFQFISAQWYTCELSSGNIGNAHKIWDGNIRRCSICSMFNCSCIEVVGGRPTWIYRKIKWVTSTKVVKPWSKENGGCLFQMLASCMCEAAANLPRTLDLVYCNPICCVCVCMRPFKVGRG